MKINYKLILIILCSLIFTGCRNDAHNPIISIEVGDNLSITSLSELPTPYVIVYNNYGHKYVYLGYNSYEVISTWAIRIEKKINNEVKGTCVYNKYSWMSVEVVDETNVNAEKDIPSEQN